MLYLLLHDVVLLSFAPIMARELVRAGQAILDPPHRDGGYIIADDERLYQMLYRRACDMECRKNQR